MNDPTSAQRHLLSLPVDDPDYQWLRNNLFSLATLDQYLAWLDAYLQAGGTPTMLDPRPFNEAGFVYAAVGPVLIDGRREYGDLARRIITAPAITMEPVNGWADTTVYSLGDPPTIAGRFTVPVFTDIEFRDLLNQAGCPTPEGSIKQAELLVDDTGTEKILFFRELHFNPFTGELESAIDVRVDSGEPYVPTGMVTRQDS